MTPIRCLNCGAFQAVRSGDDLTCTACKHRWTVADEQANAHYIRTALGREPLAPAQVADSTKQESQPEKDEDQTPDLTAEYLETLNLDELRDLADALQIDLGKAKVKADVIQLILAAAEHNKPE